MKKYDGVVLRAQMYEYKKGIDYAKPQTRLYKWLRGLYTLVFVYTFLMNLFFVCGMLLNIDAGIRTFSDVSKNIFIVGIATVVALVAVILMYCKEHIVSGILGALSLPVTLFVFAPLLKEDMYPIEGWFGYKESFFWRHFIPVVILVFFAVWMTVIAIRAKVLFSRTYKKVCDDLFEKYKSELGENEVETESSWEEYLKNYHPDDYKTEKGKKKKNRNKKKFDEEKNDD